MKDDKNGSGNPANTLRARRLPRVLFVAGASSASFLCTVYSGYQPQATAPIYGLAGLLSSVMLAVIVFSAPKDPAKVSLLLHRARDMAVRLAGREELRDEWQCHDPSWRTTRALLLAAVRLPAPGR